MYMLNMFWGPRSAFLDPTCHIYSLGTTTHIYSVCMGPTSTVLRYHMPHLHFLIPLVCSGVFWSHMPHLHFLVAHCTFYSFWSHMPHLHYNACVPLAYLTEPNLPGSFPFPVKLCQDAFRYLLVIFSTNTHLAALPQEQSISAETWEHSNSIRAGIRNLFKV